MATERISSGRAGAYRLGGHLAASTERQFKVNPLAVAGAMVGLTALDMITTQLFFNFAHTDSAHAEKSLIGQTLMQGGNNVFTPDVLKLEAGKLAYQIVPYLALKGVSRMYKNQPNSWMNYGTNLLANMFAIGPLVTGSYVGLTNSWNVLHAAGALPTYAPWENTVNSALQYWFFDAHLLDAPLQGLMNYWDFADSTGLGIGKFSLLTLGAAGLVGTGAVVGAKKYNESRKKA